MADPINRAIHLGPGPAAERNRAEAEPRRHDRRHLLGRTARFLSSMNPEGETIAKNQNTFAKRQREMEKKRKAEEKRKRRNDRKAADAEPVTNSSEESAETVSEQLTEGEND